MKIVGIACSPRKGKTTAHAPDGVAGDTFGMQSVHNLGKRAAELAIKLHG
jgi:hypothetical protein